MKERLFSLHDLLVRVPTSEAWTKERRIAALRLAGLDFKVFNSSRGVAFEFAGIKAHWYERFMLLYVSRAFYGKSADVIRPFVEGFVSQHCAALERALRGALWVGRVRVQWTRRSHYASVDDALARELRHRRKKVRHVLPWGVFVVDFSDHVDHVELQNGKHSFMDIPYRQLCEDIEAGYRVRDLHAAMAGLVELKQVVRVLENKLRELEQGGRRE